jgi:hypothetical protein
LTANTRRRIPQVPDRRLEDRRNHDAAHADLPADPPWLTTEAPLRIGRSACLTTTRQRAQMRRSVRRGGPWGPVVLSRRSVPSVLRRSSQRRSCQYSLAAESTVRTPRSPSAIDCSRRWGHDGPLMGVGTASSPSSSRPWHRSATWTTASYSNIGGRV